MAKVVIFGATDAALLNHFYLTHDSPHEVVAFTVDRNYIKERTLCGLPVVPFEDIESSYPPSDYKMLVAIFYGRVNRTRAEKYAQTKAKGYELVSYVSSKAVTWPGLVVGDNSFIGENCSMGPGVKIGNNVSISPGSVVGHDSVVKDHCFLASHTVILGCVTIEPYCFLGANSTIKNDVTVARECIIGASALITSNTIERGVYTSRPAELLPKRSNQLSTWLTWGAK
jgi:sugar O-acyltransferase (sialic acid O-acetyltransferase NeuD family)